MQTGLPNADIDVVEFRIAMTKQGIYKRLCYIHNYKINFNLFGAYPKVEEYPIPYDFDDILWPLGSEPLPVYSWSSFLKNWKAKYPNLINCQPYKNVRGDYPQLLEYRVRTKKIVSKKMPKSKKTMRKIMIPYLSLLPFWKRKILLLTKPAMSNSQLQ
jgi:hypothetical protein